MPNVQSDFYGLFASLLILPIFFWVIAKRVSILAGFLILLISFISGYLFDLAHQIDSVVATFQVTLRFFGFGLGAAIFAAALESRFMPDRYVAQNYPVQAGLLKRNTRLIVMLVFMALLFTAHICLSPQVHVEHWLKDAIDDVLIGLGAGLFIAEKQSS